MDRRRVSNAQQAGRAPLWRRASSTLPPTVHRDLIAPLFTMRMPILGFGMLFALVSGLIYTRWHDPIIAVLGLSAALVTAVRVVVISRFYKAGGSAQPLAALVRWERAYAALTFVFAALLAALNVRVLMVHEPLMLTGTVSLVFTFGAGVVSRTASRPRLCTGSLLIAVLPTAMAMLWHASQPDGQTLHGEFFLLLAFLLLAVLGMSLDSVRHLHAATLEQLVTRHDLAKLARFDALTGLPNRLMLREAYQTRLDAAQGNGTQLAIHYLDLDGFKAVNDQFGHPAGDQMLREVATRLQGAIRSDDIAFRLGGDEFVLMQASVNHRDEAELLARRVIKHLSEPYLINRTEMCISVSIGIALASSFECELDDCVASADGALYRSKARGKAQLQFAEVGNDPVAGRSCSAAPDFREVAGPAS